MLIAIQCKKNLLGKRCYCGKVTLFFKAELTPHDLRNKAFYVAQGFLAGYEERRIPLSPMSTKSESFIPDENPERDIRAMIEKNKMTHLHRRERIDSYTYDVYKTFESNQAITIDSTSIFLVSLFLSRRF